MERKVEDREIGVRLDSVVFEILSREYALPLTRNIVQSNLSEGCKVNGEVCKKSYKLKENDILTLDLQFWEDIRATMDLSEEIVGEQGNLDIRYEDEDLLVIYKAKGTVVHPGVGNVGNTIANYIRYYLESKGEYDSLMDRCGIVHRLDKGVSGLMVVAKSKESQGYLKALFQNHEVVKIYHAYVKEMGRCNLESFKESEQEIDFKKYIKEMNISFEPWKSWFNMRGYIGRSSKNRYKMEFKQYEFGGSKFAESYILKSKDQVLVKIETGRMHQIRASLEYLGLNIVGDTLYGNSSSRKQGDSIMLESVLLSFVKQNGERLTLKVYE
ncbi:MAG: RluA family pseudouridine synthase [Candidatus Dojkabacteria bacterium]|jgi:23S rRNA pseudouridine1911/1915/1917 synthase|nr:RluA family pseudouridine synthase [Candidatus Dojkabacteria bacterium]